jgi:hypothetical protein
MQKYARTLKYLLAISFFVFPAITLAISSTNYQIEEDYFSSGGNVTSSSASYVARDAIGNIGVGSSNADGTNYRNQSGPITTNFPSLSFSVGTSSVGLGTLSPASTATGTATFSVLNYTSYGYIVVINGNTPTSGANSLDGLSSQTSSSAGTEQFGINLVANTSPVSFGANPSQVPSSSFSYGSAASGYNTTNLYKYVSGDTIAQATQSSGQTNFTISYIANISGSTPAGQYTATQNLVVIPTY